MTENKQKMELLAPAGTPEAFYAALHQGADAIYIGAGSFHARQFAGDLSEETLFSLVNDAHVAGVRVYLTLNTLLSETELPLAVEAAERVWQNGIDALIVQDIGLLHVLHTRYPDMVLHASTQMSLHNLAGVQAAEAAGCSRVVLARELSLETIASIRRESALELEVFGHGALCVSYSGQCTMSSFIGGRSGNRGMCAQPCRLPWKEFDALDTEKKKVRADGYLLSMKDLMSLDLLPQLQAAGVTALKLEGRMKSPEYVSVVTGIYRKYIDLLQSKGVEHFQVDTQDVKALKQIFNRGGFTSRYLQAGTGSDAKTVSVGVPLQTKETINNLPATEGLSLFADGLVDTVHPKNRGIVVGEVLSWRYPYAQVALCEDVAVGDGLEVHAGGLGGKHAVSAMLTAILIKGAHEKVAFRGYTALLGDIKEAVGTGDLVYRTSQKTQNQKAREAIDRWQVQRVPLSMTFVMNTGAPSTLTVCDDDKHRVMVSSLSCAEQAQRQPLSEERLSEQLKKTGDSPFYLSRLQYETDGNSTLPVKEVNAMRRDALVQLTDLRKSPWLQKSTSVQADVIISEQTNRKPIRFPLYKTILAFAAVPEYSWLETAKHKGFLDTVQLIIPLPTLKKSEEVRSIVSGPIWIQIPAIVSDDVLAIMLQQLETMRGAIDGLVVSNPGVLVKLRQHFPNLPIAAGNGLNLWNCDSLNQAREWGADAALVSPELTSVQRAEFVVAFEKMNTDENKLALWQWVYGRAPVMIMEHCPGALSGSCDRRCAVCPRNRGTLVDRAGTAFPWTRDVLTQKTTIYHNMPLRWPTAETNGLGCYIFITDEGPEVLKEFR